LARGNDSKLRSVGRSPPAGFSQPANSARVCTDLRGGYYTEPVRFGRVGESC
jgi:hypothetical protein